MITQIYKFYFITKKNLINFLKKAKISKSANDMYNKTKKVYILFAKNY